MSKQIYVNRYGRKMGRGLRPWVLIPKVLAVGMYFGGLTAGAALAFGTSPETGDAYHALAETLGRVFRWSVVPGLVGALVLGVLLWLAHPWVFLRMRWLQAKLALVVLGLPGLHVVMRLSLEVMRGKADAGMGGPEGALTVFRVGLVVAMGIGAGLIVLGRQKPRLGQNLAKAYRASQKQEG